MKISLKELKKLIENIIKENPEKEKFTYHEKDLRTPFTQEYAEKAKWEEKEEEPEPKKINTITYKKDSKGKIYQFLPSRGWALLKIKLNDNNP